MDPIDPAIWATTQSSQSKSNPLWAGLKLTTLDLGSKLAGTYGAVGRGLGVQSLADAGTNVAGYLDQKSQEQGRPDLEKNPWEEGGAPVLPWLVYQGAKLVPTLAGLAVAPEIGAEALGANVAKSLGMGAVSLPFAPGQVYNAAGDKPGGATQEDALKSLALSPVVAALNSFAPGLLMNGIGGHLIGNLASKVATKTVVGGFLAKAGAGALVDGAAGAIQGGASTALVQEAVRPDLTPQQKMSNIVESTVTGGVLGGLAGGAISGFRPSPGLDVTRSLKEKPAGDITNDDLTAAIDTAHAPTAPEAPPQATQEQAPPPAPARPYEHLDAADLQAQYGQTFDYLRQHLDEKDQSQWTPQEQQLVAQHEALAAELQHRNSNASVTTPVVSPDAVGAVEQQSDASGGVEPNSTVAPAPTTFNIDETLKGHFNPQILRRRDQLRRGSRASSRSSREG